MHPFFARQRLSALLDGDLGDDERAQVEAMLAEHGDLSREYDAMQDAVALLRRVGPVVAPDEVIEELARARARPPPRRIPRVVGVAVVVGAAVLFVSLFSRSVLRDMAEKEARAELHAEIAAEPPIEVATVEVEEEVEPHDVAVIEPEPAVPVVAPSVVAAPASAPAAAPARPVVHREPYQAEWEMSAQLVRSRSIRLHTGDPQILFKIDDLADEHGGALFSGNVGLLDTELAYGQVSVRLPGASLEGFMAGIGALASLTSSPPPPADPDGSVEMVVEVQYHP